MSTEDNALSAKNLFLLTLKGEITVQFTDDHTLEGEFVTQDELNIFVRVDNELVMIPRSQIRYLKGRQGQPAEKDDSQARVLATGISESFLETQDAESPLPDIDELYETDATVVLPEEPEEILATPEFETTPESVGLKVQDVGIEFENDEDPTLVFEEEIEADELEDATFVLPQEESPTQEIPAYLDCTSGPHAGEVFQLTAGCATIGRAGDNIFSLAKDKEISRRHSKIEYEAGNFVIEDQNSLNGTFVNDERIEGPRYLEDGDEILVGVSTLIFRRN
ncbi:MAG: FHA domain-containing protein [Anaerolineae bacterium]|nr:FHA domain-containing protein [Anaerolineae bacterium]